MIETTTYGIHWDNEGVAYLMQGSGGQNALGLDREPPFKITPSKNMKCPHNIKISPGKPSQTFIEQTSRFLAQKANRPFLPIPKDGDEGVYFIPESLMERVKQRSDICGPRGLITFPHWTLTEAEFMRQCYLTNMAPLILNGFRVRDSRKMFDMSRTAAYSPRTVIFVGEEWTVVPREIPRLNPRGRVPVDVLPDLASFVVKEYMQKRFDRGSYKFFTGK